LRIGLAAGRRSAAAFWRTDSDNRGLYDRACCATRPLYYRDQPSRRHSAEDRRAAVQGWESRVLCENAHRI